MRVGALEQSAKQLRPPAGVVRGAGRRPRFGKWFVASFTGGEQDWMDQTARYYSHVTRDLRRAYLNGDKRLEWLKDLTLERLKLSGENFRSYVIALGATLVSFIAAQLSADVPTLPLAANLIAILAVLLAFLYLSIRLEYNTIHLSARINGLCDILVATESERERSLSRDEPPRWAEEEEAREEPVG